MKSIHATFYGNAIIWFAVVAASGIILRNTEHFSQIFPSLLGGRGASNIIFLGGVGTKENARVNLFVTG